MAKNIELRFITSYRLLDKCFSLLNEAMRVGSTCDTNTTLLSAKEASVLLL